MAPKQECAKYQYVVTSSGPKILPVDEPSCKDEESPADYNAGGYLPVKLNDTFKHGRYKVLRKLGWGHFSTVWLVKDTQLNRHSALKVVKSAGRYAETARDEIKLLSRVQSFSPTHPGRLHIVSFLDSFCHQGPEASHVCIVFEPLGENLLALIERNKKKGVARPLVKVVAKQILLGLQYLHDECDLVHTDIKPENILISIPDIEAHIYSELSQSPSPKSRRVGVPLPNKSRSGVTIPPNQQRASRRQVQIFDSQPLSSPGRSAGLHSSISVGLGHGSGSGSNSGVNSVSSSYIAEMQIPKYGASTGIPKVSSGLSMSVPHRDGGNVPSTSSSPKKPNTQSGSGGSALSQGILNSPSTSSSSSSLASTSTSTGAGSGSMVSTPPTSLSHSLGNAMSSLITTHKPNHSFGITVDVVPVEERLGLPMKGKGKEKAVFNSTPPQNLSWKEAFLGGSSWEDKVSPLASTSYKSTTSGGGRSKPAHSRSNSGIPVSGSWKDPGLAAPAPAVVVNAVARADGDHGEGPDYFQIVSSSSVASSNGTIGTESSLAAKSESSSATVTAARPSPTGDVPPATSNLGSSNPSSCSTPSGSKVSPNLESLFSSNVSTPKPKLGFGNNPSLLSQTAPSRVAHVTSHNSPPHHASQLSAHMYSRPSQLADGFVTSQPAINQNAKVSPRGSMPISSIDVAGSVPTAPPSTPNLISPSTPSLSVDAPSQRPELPSVSLNSPIAIAPPPIPPVHLTPVIPPIPNVHPISIKIADLGNATPSTRHYTEDIQTRQYRAPEAILGRKDWDARTDIWSVACVVFELLTAEYLFDPQGQGELFSKDDDHMAQIIELLGDFALDAKMGGRYSRDLFDHTGSLRYIKTLKPWPLKRVMAEKYLYSEQDAVALCEFLGPMLVIDQKKRACARDMVNHKWLEPSGNEEVVTDW